MFDSLHITYLLKTICEENDIEVLPDTVELKTLLGLLKQFNGF